MKHTLLLIGALSLAACDGNEPGTEAPGADLVFTHGRVYTVDPDRTWAEAVAITDGRITFVGSDADAKAWVGPETRVVDLDGRMMMPAFQDSHIHPISSGVAALACDLSEFASLDGYGAALAEYAAAITGCAATHPEAEWITGGGWLMSVFGPGGRPSKTLIDEVVPDRPVYLTSADGHTGWANSRALEAAGITRDTPDPPDGLIDRDPETGEATGGLQEGAMKLVEAHIPPITLEDRIEGLIHARDMLHRYGITAINDAEVHRPDLETYRALEERGELDLRVVASLWWDRDRGLEQIDELIGLREAFDRPGLVRPSAIKIYQDGVIENYTAAMLEPYLVPGGTRGIPMVEPELLKRAVVLLDQEGFQVHFHAIGTGAVRQALDAIERALNENGPLDHRHHIAHLELIHPDDLPRFAQLATIANFQPLWAYNDSYITDLTVPFIGEARAQWLYPIGSVLGAGGMVAFGSDWAVSTANPMPQIQTAVTRLSPFGQDVPVLLPGERIDLESAIAAFTRNAAYLNHLDEDTGSIEVGKLADLIVLDRNLFEIDPGDISDVRVVLTLFEGRPVHDDLGVFQGMTH